MDQAKQLSELVRQAFENGWALSYPTIEIKSWHVSSEHAIEFTYTVLGSEQLKGFGSNWLSVNDLLFGDDLRFLKALVGDNRRTMYQSPQWSRLARELVEAPYGERIPFLYEHVFGEGQK